MNGREYVRLGLRVLDEQIVDCEGRRCGRVEDLELDAGPGAPATVTSILCGATAWRRRAPRTIGRFYRGDPAALRRVPWGEVTETGNEIHLRTSEDQLPEAGQSDAGAMALSQLIGSRFAGARGRDFGRVYEVLGSRPEGSEPHVPWELYGLLTGRAAMFQRLGYESLIEIKLRDGEVPENLVPWEWVTGIDERGRLIMNEPEGRIWSGRRMVWHRRRSGSANP